MNVHERDRRSAGTMDEHSSSEGAKKAGAADAADGFYVELSQGTYGVNRETIDGGRVKVGEKIYHRLCRRLVFLDFHKLFSHI